ncbi:MAG: DUF5320 family protein [Armatimonadota bacterium]
MCFASGSGCFGGEFHFWAWHHHFGPHWHHFGPPWFARRFHTKEERKRMLEEYKEFLQKELAAVDEMLKDLGG